MNVVRRIVIAGSALLFTALVAAAAPQDSVVKATKIGNPAWKPVGAQVFAAPIGTTDSGYAEFLDTMLAVMPAPDHEFNPSLGIGPGTPHDGPYDGEMAEGVAANGYPAGTKLDASAMTGGNGTWLALLLVPDAGAPTGSSPDFASGPILSNDIFPMTVTNVVKHGSVADGPFSFEVPKLDGSLSPPFSVDGHSHVPLFLAESSDFFPGRQVQGSYAFTSMIMDAEGNGWVVTARVSINN